MTYAHYGEARPIYAVLDMNAAQWNVQHPEEAKKELFTFKEKSDAKALRKLMEERGVPSKLLSKHIPAWVIEDES